MTLSAVQSSPRIENWFPADVYIRQVSTGEVRVHRSHEIVIDGHWSPFIWEDGNYSCDCNRSLFFNNIGFLDMSTDVKCTENLFRIDKIIHILTGEVIYEENSG